MENEGQPSSTAVAEPPAPAAPATDSPAPAAPSEGSLPAEGGSTPPEPTDPAPQTPDPDLPDRGIDPDKGIDPEKGDEPTDPNKDKGSEPVDLSKMSRPERAEYFRNQSQQVRRTTERAIDSNYQPQPMDELEQHFKDQGYDDFQAKSLASSQYSQQKAQIAEARAEISELNSGLATSAMEVVATLPWANPANKDAYDHETTELASKLYEDMCLTKDDRSGQVIEAKMMPAEFYNLVDTIRNSGSSKAAAAAQKAAAAEMAAVAPPSSSKQSGDPKFENLSAKEMAAQLRSDGHDF